MISFIRGELTNVEANGIVIDHQGLGFFVMTPTTVLEHLPPLQSQVQVYTYLYIKEGVMDLYGFATRQERNLFQTLIGINGIGPKAAIAILSTLSVEQLQYTVLSDDVKTITKTPGIGTKGAQRLIIELKDKLQLEEELEATFGGEELKDSSHLTKNNVAMALVSLGYSNAEALRAISKVKNADELIEETLLKEALKKIMTPL